MINLLCTYLDSSHCELTLSHHQLEGPIESHTVIQNQSNLCSEDNCLETGLIVVHSLTARPQGPCLKLKLSKVPQSLLSQHCRCDVDEKNVEVEIHLHHLPLAGPSPLHLQERMSSHVEQMFGRPLEMDQHSPGIEDIAASILPNCCSMALQESKFEWHVLLAIYAYQTGIHNIFYFACWGARNSSLTLCTMVDQKPTTLSTHSRLPALSCQKVLPADWTFHPLLAPADLCVL